MDIGRFFIESQRLILVPAGARYSKEVFTYYRPPVTDYMHYPSPKDLVSLQKRMKQREEDMKKSLLLYLAILDKHSREFLGSAGIDDLSSNNPELGAWLKESAQGLGYGKEALSAITLWANENLNYAYFLWPCAKENIASCKLAEHLGGKIARTYLKTNYQGIKREYFDYHIPKASKL